MKQGKKLYLQTRDMNSFEERALICQDKFYLSLYILKKENEMDTFQ